MFAVCYNLPLAKLLIELVRCFPPDTICVVNSVIFRSAIKLLLLYHMIVSQHVNNSVVYLILCEIGTFDELVDVEADCQGVLDVTGGAASCDGLLPRLLFSGVKSSMDSYL